ncbi:hypothetical protein RRG08_005563 [Elysia crispata]|uniref:Ferritin n=1 Tax=Elysia crispata TaxID=231223 RepID=A0AAE1AMF1_9GAST|nr:hypothetical protein RRG08_005563 [Elysia crispata]
MKRSTRRKDIYMCVKNEWTRRDGPHGYCIADIPVKEVRQHSSHHEEMNKLMSSSYKYLAMAAFYKRADVALPGFVKLMTDLFEIDMNFARDLITYVTKRGDSLNLLPIYRPSAYEDLLVFLAGRTGLPGLEEALNDTKSLHTYTLKVIESARGADDKSDPHRKHVLEDGVLNHKVNTTKKLADLLHRLETFKSDEDYYIGEYHVDLELRN